MDLQGPLPLIVSREPIRVRPATEAVHGTARASLQCANVSLYTLIRQRQKILTFRCSLHTIS